jgi:hypothetical protein
MDSINLAIVVNLQRYKALVKRISRTQFHDAELEARARKFWSLALKAGYDPVKDIGIYRGL